MAAAVPPPQCSSAGQPGHSSTKRQNKPSPPLESGPALVTCSSNGIWQVCSGMLGARPWAARVPARVSWRLALGSLPLRAQPLHHEKAKPRGHVWAPRWPPPAELPASSELNHQPSVPLWTSSQTLRWQQPQRTPDGNRVKDPKREPNS